MFFYLKLLVLPPRSHETWKQSVCKITTTFEILQAFPQKVINTSKVFSRKTFAVSIKTS